MTTLTELGKGIIVPMLTPLTEDHSIDAAGLRRLIDYLVEGGVHGVFVMGSTGEFARLSRREWEKGVVVATEHAAGRVPVYVGVSAAGAREALSRTRAAAAAGAEAAVLSPGYYYPYSQEEIYQLYATVGGGDLLPLFLYNIPPYTQSTIEPRTVRRVVETVRITGIKDSSGDLQLFGEYLALSKDYDGFSVLVGSEPIMFDALKAGASGAVPSLGNVFPTLLREVYDAALQKDWPRAEELCSRIQEINTLNDLVPSSMGVVAWKKRALEELGVCRSWVTEPSPIYTSSMIDTIKGYLRKHCSQAS